MEFRKRIWESDLYGRRSLFLFPLPEGTGIDTSAAWLDWNPTLDARSVAIDSGNNDYLDADNRTDYLGKTRLVNGIVDRGAAEWQTHEFAFNEDFPITSMEVSDAKAGTVIAEFTSKGFAAPVYSFTVDGENSTDFFVLDPDTGTLSLANKATVSTVYKNIVIAVMEPNGTCVMSLPAFTLTIADKIIDDPTSHIFTIDCDGSDTTDQVTITTENGQTQFDRNGGILVISGSKTQSDTFFIANNALENMKLIDIKSDNDSAISNRDVLFIYGNSESNDITVSGDQGSNGTGLIEQAQAASIRFNGIKNVFFAGSDSGDDIYHINSLAVNFNIRETTGATLDLSKTDITLGGVILDAGSLFHQSILVGQQGTLRIEDSANVTNIVLPNGTNEVKGNKGDVETVISGGGAESYNVISLYGGSNEVTLSGQTKLTAYDSTSENAITITDGNGSTINMSATSGGNIVNTVEISGDRVGVYGGQGTTEITEVHGNHSMIVLDKAATAEVTIDGDSNKIITGAGDDTVHYQGNNGYVSTGAGNDTIIITGENSTSNTFNTGTGTNSIDAMATGSDTANVYYLTNSDILLGRKSNDIVYRSPAPVATMLPQESLAVESALPEIVIESSNSVPLALFEDDDFENTLDILSESIAEQFLTDQERNEFSEPFESFEEDLLAIPNLEIF